MGQVRHGFATTTVLKGGSPPSIAGLPTQQLAGRTGPSDPRDCHALAFHGEGMVTLSGGVFRCFPELAGNRLLSIPQAAQIVGPVLHHPHPRIPIFAPRSAAAHGMVIAAGKLALDRVRMP